MIPGTAICTITPMIHSIGEPVFIWDGPGVDLGTMITITLRTTAIAITTVITRHTIMAGDIRVTTDRIIQDTIMVIMTDTGETHIIMTMDGTVITDTVHPAQLCHHMVQQPATQALRQGKTQV